MRKIILLVFLASLSLSAVASDFTVIGMDSSGNETHGQIQESDYKKLINFEMQQSDENGHDWFWYEWQLEARSLCHWSRSQSPVLL
jgi:hypothetical protein